MAAPNTVTVVVWIRIPVFTPLHISFWVCAKVGESGETVPLVLLAKRFKSLYPHHYGVVLMIFIKYNISMIDHNEYIDMPKDLTPPERKVFTIAFVCQARLRQGFPWQWLYGDTIAYKLGYDPEPWIDLGVGRSYSQCDSLNEMLLNAQDCGYLQYKKVKYEFLTLDGVVMRQHKFIIQLTTDGIRLARKVIHEERMKWISEMVRKWILPILGVVFSGIAAISAAISGVYLVTQS